MRRWVLVSVLFCGAALAADDCAIPLDLNSLGQRKQNNNFLIDRMDNNDAWQRGAVLELSLGAIETVSLVAPFVPPELGHGTGASIDVRSSAGSDQVHGSAFLYHQDSAASARNFFDGARKPGLLANQFGGSIGGPLRKTWFFFLSAELLRQRRGLTVVSTVPTAAQKSGDFGPVAIYDPLTINQVQPMEYARQPFPGNRIPLARMPVQARDLVALYPDPNLPGLANNYRFTPPLIQNGNRLDGRTDKALSAAHKLFARLSYGSQQAQTPGALPEMDASTRLAAWSGVASLTSTPRPSLVNELRAGATRSDMTGSALDDRPTVTPSGYAQLGATGPVPFKLQSAAYQVDETVLWTTGRHAWRFGFQAIRRHVDGAASEWTSRGTYIFTPDYTSQVGVDATGNAIASLLTGYPSEFRRDIQYQPFRLRGWEWAGFVEDDLRLTRRLTLQAGARYSLYPPVTEADGRLVNFNYSRTAPALDQFAGQGGVNQYAGVGYKKWAIAPRIGFALDLGGGGATVLRGAFSQTYDTGAYVVQGVLARNPPYAARQDIFASSLQLGLNLASGISTLQPGAIHAMETATNFTPYSDQWGLFLQQRLRSKLSLEVGGLGSMGVHLYSSLDANQPYPTPTPYPYRRYPYEPYVSRIDYVGLGAGSTYYGGQVKLTGELASGLRVEMLYRHAKSLDDAATPGALDESRPAGAQYIYNQRSTRALSSFDVTQKLALAVSCDLPFKLHASSQVTSETGFPFTPQLAVNGLNNGGFWLPNRVGDGSLPSSQRSYRQWFDTQAFATPALYQYGNSGFNIVRGPGLATVDAALARDFSLGGPLRLRASVEGFNLLNGVNLALPNRILGLSSSGTISHTSTPARSFQLGAKLEW